MFVISPTSTPTTLGTLPGRNDWGPNPKALSSSPPAWNYWGPDPDRERYLSIMIAQILFLVVLELELLVPGALLPIVLSMLAGGCVNMCALAISCSGLPIVTRMEIMRFCLVFLCISNASSVVVLRLVLFFTFCVALWLSLMYTHPNCFMSYPKILFLVGLEF